MVITYHGETYFKLQAGDLIVLVDPANQRSFKGANLILNTLKPAPTVVGVDIMADGGTLWIDHQGEYEIKGIEVRSWSVGNDRGVEKTVYRFIMDNLAIVVLGRVERQLSENLQEHLHGADIILGPAVKTGGWVRQLKPAIIIPVLSGGKTSQSLGKLVIKKKDIIPGKTKIVCLSS
jgi:hypothetical protein